MNCVRLGIFRQRVGGFSFFSPLLFQAVFIFFFIEFELDFRRSDIVALQSDHMSPTRHHVSQAAKTTFGSRLSASVTEQEEQIPLGSSSSLSASIKLDEKVSVPPAPRHLARSARASFLTCVTKAMVSQDVDPAFPN